MGKFCKISILKKKSIKKSDLFSNILSFEDNLVLPTIFGDQDKNLRIIEKEFSVSITPRGNFLKISGGKENVDLTKVTLERIYEEVSKNRIINSGEINGIINIMKSTDLSKSHNDIDKVDSVSVTAGKKLIKPRSKKQIQYFNLVKKKQMVFCCGPAGTGKTYLAVAFAVSMLKSGTVDKIILTRPAVEAGERLGFLPGDLKEKIDPYLRPIYDALNDMLSFSEVMKKIEMGFIEIAPLAFMRGRTLKNSFAILDEAQNATDTQIKMFLTRIGENSKIVVNGDPSQIDLPNKNMSGLDRSKKILSHLDEISVIDFDHSDVVRHPLVSKIVKAYSKND